MTAGRRADSLVPGDRLLLSGGYDMEPQWLGGASSLTGRLTAFIPGQNEPAAAVVKLDKPLDAMGVSGDFVVLELRYVGAAWKSDGVVHVELCDFEPPAIAWSKRRQGKWMESHASYSKILPEHPDP